MSDETQESDAAERLSYRIESCIYAFAMLLGIAVCAYNAKRLHFLSEFQITVASEQK